MGRNLRQLSDRKQAIFPAFQFSIRSIFLITALVALAILFLREVNLRFGPIATAVSVLTFLSIFGHVAGAALGSRLRSSRDLPDRDLERDDVPDDEALVPEQRLVQPLEAQSSDFAPATQLSHQKPLNNKPIYWAVGSGAVFGSLVASIVLTWFMWDDLAIVNVLFGAVSAAVIGGLFGYLLGSLYQVVRDALAEAQEKT